jgi:cytochrome c oxidase cbb3-type subunit 1
MYVVRGLGGTLFLLGSLIMCYNLWKTVTSAPAQANAGATVAAE